MPASLPDPEDRAGSGFGRALRILNAAEYQRVFAKATRIGHRHITLLVRANQLDHPRLGLAIAKRELRRAVARNRIKRLIRESFRQNQHTIGSYDIVVMVRSSIEGLDNTRLWHDFNHFWQEVPQRCSES